LDCRRRDCWRQVLRAKKFPFTASHFLTCSYKNSCDKIPQPALRPINLTRYWSHEVSRTGSDRKFHSTIDPCQIKRLPVDDPSAAPKTGVPVLAKRPGSGGEHPDPCHQTAANLYCSLLQRRNVTCGGRTTDT